MLSKMTGVILPTTPLSVEEEIVNATAKLLVVI